MDVSQLNSVEDPLLISTFDICLIQTFKNGILGTLTSTDYVLFFSPLGLTDLHL